MLRNLIKITGDNNYNLLKHSMGVKTFATYEKEQHEADEVPAETNHNRRINEVIGKYSEQDVEKILKVLNNYSLKELLGYDISKTRINKLLAYRMRNGLLRDLHDIFFVEGFGLKVADKFYQSLLQEPKAAAGGLEKKLRAKTAPFVTPSLEAGLRVKFNSCIALRIGVNSITWSKLELAREQGCNKPCQLTHWQHHEISEKKLHLSELIKRCLYVCHQIPQADCYLFENPQMAQVSNNPGSVEQQNINIQRAQVTAMMGYALAARNTLKDSHLQADREDSKKPLIYPTVFYLRRFLTARLFNYLVGTERVSSEQTVMELMRTYYNQEDFTLPEDEEIHEIKSSAKDGQKDVSSIQGNVQFPMDLRHMFAKAQRVHREFLGQALLLNLTFVRLVLLQDSKCIDRVSRGGKNMSDTNVNFDSN